MRSKNHRCKSRPLNSLHLEEDTIKDVRTYEEGDGLKGTAIDTRLTIEGQEIRNEHAPFIGNDLIKILSVCEGGPKDLK